MISTLARHGLCAALPAMALAAACSGTPSGPSVVLVVVDTLRADHMSLYGYERATTPALERAAQRGFVFERAHATSPWTLPSFASIFTGALPREHGVGSWLGRDIDARSGVPAGAMRVHGVTKRFAALASDLPTLPELLRDHGYATGAVVNNPFLSPVFGLARGFDVYDYEMGGDEGSRRADVMVDRSLAWIEAQGSSYFALVHLFDPHMNYAPPPEVAGRFTAELRQPDGISLPVRDTHRLRRAAPSLHRDVRAFVGAAYDEEIAFVDAQLGRLLERLSALPDPPLVVITADHGEELFERDSFGHGHTAFQEQLGVPLLFFGPFVATGREDVPVSIADVAPTILDAVGVPVPEAMTGTSLWPRVSRGEALPLRAVFAERTGEGPERQVVIAWPYKLIITLGNEEPRLYDLAADPAERVDIHALEPEVAALLAARLPGELTPVDAKQTVELDTETTKALRALGYLGDAKAED